MKKKPSPTIAVDVEQYGQMFTALTEWYHDGAPLTCPESRRFAREIFAALGIELKAHPKGRAQRSAK